MPAGAVAGVGAVAGMYSAKKGADAQRGAARESAGVQRYMFDTARRDQMPWMETGRDALSELRGMMGIGGPDTSDIDSQIASLEEELSSLQSSGGPGWLAEGLTQAGGRPSDMISADPAYSSSFAANRLNDRAIQGHVPPGRGERLDELRGRLDRLRGQRSTMIDEYDPEAYDITTTPGYQFRFDEGQKALGNQLAGSGLRLSGRAIKEAQRFGQGMASGEFGNRFNRLASLAGLGQTATQATGSLGAQAGANIGSSLMQAGNAQAAGYMGVNNALQGGLQNALYAYNQAQPRNPVNPQGYTTYGSLGAIP